MLTFSPCAGIDKTNGKGCIERASKVCGSCHLVAYCSPKCQKSTWPEHKSICQSSLVRDTWLPSYATRSSPPDFFDDNYQRGPATPHRYLWGNTPAINVLQLGTNEGVKWEHNLAVCFAASGDPRSLFKTIAALPNDFPGKFSFVMNDKDEIISFRNVAMLLLLLDGKPETIDTLLHLWYSARLTPKHLDIIDKLIVRPISEIIQKFQNAEGENHMETFSAGRSSVRIVLKKPQWMSLLQIFRCKLNPKVAESSRSKIVLGRMDHIERSLYNIRRNLHLREAKLQFRKRGILLPFEATTDENFTSTNPTLVDKKGTWLLRDNADPLEGWEPHKFLSPSDLTPGHLGSLNNDVYGHLHFHVQDVLRNVKNVMDNVQIEIIVIHGDAQVIPRALPGSKFDRLDVSNIIDGGYLGLERTLRLGKALLRESNPNAVMLSCFYNAIPEIRSGLDPEQLGIDQNLVMRRLSMKKSIPPSVALFRAFAIMTTQAFDLLIPFESIFERYMDFVDMSRRARQVGMNMRKEQKIIEAYPYALKMQDGLEAQAQKEFEALFASGLVGHERYVEWQLTDEMMTEDEEQEFLHDIAFSRFDFMRHMFCRMMLGLD